MVWNPNLLKLEDPFSSITPGGTGIDYSNNAPPDPNAGLKIIGTYTPNGAGQYLGPQATPATSNTWIVIAVIVLLVLAAVYFMMTAKK